MLQRPDHKDGFFVGDGGHVLRLAEQSDGRRVVTTWQSEASHYEAEGVVLEKRSIVRFRVPFPFIRH